MSADKDEDKARFWSVSNEDAEYTKHWVRKFILAKKLGVPPQIPAQDMNRLQDMWGRRHDDDIQEAEYRRIWYEAEREMGYDR